MFNPFSRNPFDLTTDVLNTQEPSLDDYLSSSVPLGPMSFFEHGYGTGARTMQFNPGAQLDPSQVNFWLGASNPWTGFTANDTRPVYYDPLPRWIPNRVGPGGQWITPGTGGYPWGPEFEAGR